jgi:hypothetical protein
MGHPIFHRSAVPLRCISQVKSIEAGFGLTCLNHACDENVKVMSDLFGGHHEGGR